MAKFHKLKVQEVRKETEDTVSVSFMVPSNLRDEFKFTPGQYLTLKQLIDDQDIRRSYSICTSPQENDLRVAIKQVHKGLFSTFANTQLKKGDEIDVMTPSGKFSPTISSENKKNYLLISAGSGVTPVLSIAKTILQEEPNSKVSFIYGNKGFASIIFREEIEGLKNDYIDRFRLFHVLSRENLGLDLFKGRITKEKINQLGAVIDYDSVSDVFICGPEEMIHASAEALEDAGVAKGDIHFELFTSPLGKLQSVQKEEVLDVDKVVEVDLTLDGDQYSFMMSEKENILDAAMSAGADVPFACKGGVCCTCKAKLIEGEVDMEVHYGLEPDEIENNYILTCQSTPLTKKVVVDFDQLN